MAKIVHGDTGATSNIYGGHDKETTEVVKMWVDVVLLNEVKYTLEGMADELEAWYREKYMDSDGEFLHPIYERRYNRDMEIVLKARRLLEMLGGTNP